MTQTVQPWERKQTDRQTDRRTDGQTDGRYQVHYLPRFAVDKNSRLVHLTINKTARYTGMIINRWTINTSNKSPHFWSLEFWIITQCIVACILLLLTGWYSKYSFMCGGLFTALWEKSMCDTTQFEVKRPFIAFLLAKIKYLISISLKHSKLL